MLTARLTRSRILCPLLQPAIDVESQLAELQRKFRILEARWGPGLQPRAASARARLTLLCPMQANRKAYAEDAQTVIRRQRAAIEKVKEDNQALKNELELTASKVCLEHGLL